MAKISPIGSKDWYRDIDLRGIKRAFREHGIRAKKPVVDKTEHVHAEDDKLAERRDEAKEFLSMVYES